MRLLEGRPLNETDRSGAPLVAVVNREFVVRFMPDGDPVGRRFTWGTTDRDGAVEWFTVVGVVADAHRSGLSEPVRPTAFRSAMQQPGRRIEILLRTDGDPAALAGVGIYGVMAYVVGRRTREIGVRMALGAERWTVVTGVLRQGMLQAALGVALGSIAALGLTRYLQSQLFALEPTDPTTFTGAVAVLLVVAAAACVLPAHRAASVDAVFALKE